VFTKVREVSHQQWMSSAASPNFWEGQKMLGGQNASYQANNTTLFRKPPLKTQNN